MDKELLENMSGQEIKELIDDEIITLQELPDFALEKALDFETEMLCHGSGDMDIIRQCSAILDERSKSNKLNHDEICAVVNKAKSEYVTIIDVNNSHSVAPQKRIRFVLKRIAIVAAAILIMASTTIAVSAVLNVDISDYLKNIVKAPEGTTVNVDEFTFYKVGISKKYDSIQKVAEDENLDIMYPTLLPEGYDIESIQIVVEPNGQNTFQIFTNDAQVGIHIELDSSEIPISSTK